MGASSIIGPMVFRCWSFRGNARAGELRSPWIREPNSPVADRRHESAVRVQGPAVAALTGPGGTGSVLGTAPARVADRLRKHHDVEVGRFLIRGSGPLAAGPDRPLIRSEGSTEPEGDR